MHLQPSVAPPYTVGARIARPFISDVIITFRAGARRVIGATAKPLYPIDGKAEGIDRRNLPDLPPRGRGTAAAVEGVRTHCFYAEYLFLSTYRTYEAYEAYEAQEPIFGKTADFDGAGIATVRCICNCWLHRRIPFVSGVIQTIFREGARRGLGATAKPLYAIDRKTGGFVGRVTLWGRLHSLRAMRARAPLGLGD